MEMRINVQDHKVSLLKELLEYLPYVTIESTKDQVLKDLDVADKKRGGLQKYSWTTHC
jgi:hypothetical protein